MKELSVEEKAERYVEALNIARALNRGEHIDTPSGTTVCETIFPELKESEDEKIRKAIYNCVKWFGFDSCFFKDVSQEECFDWLEKQGEQKPADKVEPRFHEGDKIHCKLDDRTFVIKEVDLENGVYRYTENGCGDDIDYADEMFELVSDWSEEDESYLSHVFTAVKAYYTDDKGLENPWREELLRWLKSLKDRVQPQPKQEWSEDDDDMLYKATAVINRLCAEGKECVWSISTLKKLFYWLKSLKDRYAFKPSDEQMKALCFVKKAKILDPYERESLDNLYRQLKKLKE